MDALIKRQMDLIACLGHVDKLGRSLYANAATTKMLDSVKEQLMGTAATGTDPGSTLGGGKEDIKILNLIGTGTFGKVGL